MEDHGHQNPLSRAHVLSAQASVLLKPPNQTPQALHEALKLYQEAADLFAQSNDDVRDPGARQTLGMLVTQHRNLVKDLQRRINSAAAAQKAPEPSTPTRRPAGAHRSHGRPGGLNPSPGDAPPFAIRAPGDPHAVPATALGVPPTPFDHTLSPLGSSSSSSDPESSYIHFGVHDTNDPFSRFWGMLENMLDEVSNPVAFTTLPLDLPPIKENVYEVKETRHKNPRRRSSKKKAERGLDEESWDVVDDERASSVEQDKDKDKPWVLVDPPSDLDAKPYVWAPGGGAGQAAYGQALKSRLLIGGKTPEELALENEGLRASLDTLASQAHALEKANKALREMAEEREKTMRTVVNGVRREAQKAKHGQDLMRSQLLASTASFPSTPPAASPSAPSIPTPSRGGMAGFPRPPFALPLGTGLSMGVAGMGLGGEGESPMVAAATAPLRKKVRELENELQTVRVENEKQRARIERYKARNAKIKEENAKRKEAQALQGASAVEAGQKR